MRLIDADAIKLPKGFFEEVDNVPKFYEWLNTLPTIEPKRENEEIKAQAYAEGFRTALEAILGMLKGATKYEGLKDGDEWEEPEINPCRGCDDYDGRGGCKSHGGCGAERSEE